MEKGKAILVTIVIFTFIVLLSANLVMIFPNTLPWILGIFAIPGAWKFCRVCYIWLTTKDKTAETYEDYAAFGGYK